MEVIVERESVCMGDDCLAPHTRTYKLDDNATYMDLLECLKNNNYLPSVSGNNVVWVMKSEHYSCIFSYFTKTDKLFMRLEEKFLKIICKDSNKLMFQYYTSPHSWKESIYRMYDNDEYAMYQDGWENEIKFCDTLEGSKD